MGASCVSSSIMLGHDWSTMFSIQDVEETIVIAQCEDGQWPVSLLFSIGRCGICGNRPSIIEDAQVVANVMARADAIWAMRKEQFGFGQ